MLHRHRVRESTISGRRRASGNTSCRVEQVGICGYMRVDHRLMYVAGRYYALSAASALFKHAEAKLNTRFAASSLRIRYVQVEGTMMIDPETSRNLELVGNMASKRSTHSLFGYGSFALHVLPLTNSA